LQHLRGRRLLLQRLAQLESASLHLVEQPRVLNRDHGLVGEGLDQRDLRIGERLDLQAIGQNDAEQFILFEHRDGENGPECFDVFCLEGIFWVGLHIVDVDRSALEHSAARCAVPAWPDRMVRHPLFELRRRVVIRHHAKELAVEAVNESKPSFAKPDRALRYRLEYWPQIEGGAADYFEQICGGSLLLQRFPQLRRVFSMAMTACAAKFVTSSICLSVNGRTSWRRIPMAPIS
jgi:hypothetical protein